MIESNLISTKLSGLHNSCLLHVTLNVSRTIGEHFVCDKSDCWYWVVPLVSFIFFIHHWPLSDIVDNRHKNSVENLQLSILILPVRDFLSHFCFLLTLIHTRKSFQVSLGVHLSCSCELGVVQSMYLLRAQSLSLGAHAPVLRYLPVYRSVYLSVCLSIDLSVSLFVSTEKRDDVIACSR